MTMKLKIAQAFKQIYQLNYHQQARITDIHFLYTETIIHIV